MLAALRDAAWLDQSRVRGYSIILFIVPLITLIWWVSISDGMISTVRTPVGNDFSAFRAAASLVAEGQPQAAYDPDVHHARARQLFGGRDVPLMPFFYPPTFLLICWPLAFLPYGGALAAWLGLTGLAYWRALRGFLPLRHAILPILAFPGFFVNAGFGQTGFLSGALMGFGALQLSRRPVVAGLCFGGLIYKPHLGLLIPITLAAAGAWRAFAAAGAMALALLAASWVAFGTATWQAFFNSTRIARAMLDMDLIGYEKIQSLFGSFRLAGLGLTAAYTVHALAALIAAGALVWFARRRPDGTALGAALAAASLLMSPYLLTYDLCVLAVPIAWLVAEGLAAGFKPWEKLALLLAYLLPMIAQLTVMARLPVPWTPVVTALILLLVLRRARRIAA